MLVSITKEEIQQMSMFKKAEPNHCTRCGKAHDGLLTFCWNCRPYKVAEVKWDELDFRTNEIASDGWDLLAVAAAPVTSWIKGGPTYQLFFKRRQVGTVADSAARRIPQV